MVLETEYLGLVLIAWMRLGEHVGQEDDLELVEVELLGHLQQQ